ncbi:hypothetical protein G7046_g2007 [Stylonectria norvegica]|nr:hypothetical protein G7046_g2007 [Stylonectria norvegica]
MPRLGDFSRLSELLPPRPPKLGNFDKLFAHISSLPRSQVKAQVQEIPPEDVSPETLPRISESQNRFSALLGEEPTILPITDFDSDSSNVSCFKCICYDESASSSSTPCTTPLNEREQSPPPAPAYRKRSAGEPKAQANEAKEVGHVERPLPQLFTYLEHRHGPLKTIRGVLRTRAEKHQTLTEIYVAESISDRLGLQAFPHMASNGIHLFLDMSNIIIGFENTLRAKHNLSENTIFRPQPHFNIPFFHELLARNRTIKTLNAGCSKHPNRDAPVYVKELRQLSYHVDLRDRKAEQADLGSKSTGHTRYVEDLVDETLQNRMSAAVLDNHDSPGTLVVATGDAKPAKFSDGFLVYAERALRMGFHVEIVSWRSSLSGAWTLASWMKEWEGRFRVIILDDYLDELVA